MEGVKASQNFIGKTVNEIFQKDLFNVYTQKISRIRPIIGANGAGKTTLLNFKIKKTLETIAPDSYIFLFFDFKYVTENVDQFWSIFMQKLISQLNEDDDSILNEILSKMDPSTREIKLMKILMNPELVDNTLKLISSTSNERRSALKYFYNPQLDTKTISDFFYGIIDLMLQLDYFVAIAFDELQFLDEVDNSNRLLKLFAEKFIRYLVEQYPNHRLYIAISCLQNPNEQEWEHLKNHSKNFESIIKDNEIYLGTLTTEEKNEIIQKVAKEVGFDNKNRKIFYTRMKESLIYYLPRDLLKQIARVLDTMDYVGYTEYEIRTVYEDNAREYIKEKLRKKGFKHLHPKVKEVGGYNIDIYATGSTRRSGYIPKAFGEVTITNRNRMKQKVEKFSDWLYRMRGREYNPGKGDYAFFICPPNTITDQSDKILRDNDIELVYYTSPIVEQIKNQREEGEPEPEFGTPDPSGIIKTRKKEVLIIKDERYKLEDIPGIGPKFAKKLRNGRILSIKDLINCNVKMKAKEIDGIGESRLNSWKQNARQILAD